MISESILLIIVMSVTMSIISAVTLYGVYEFREERQAQLTL